MSDIQKVAKTQDPGVGKIDLINMKPPKKEL